MTALLEKLTVAEREFLVNVLLDWDKNTKQPTSKERKMWNNIISIIDPYTAK